MDQRDSRDSPRLFSFPSSQLIDSMETVFAFVCDTTRSLTTRQALAPVDTGAILL